MTTPDQLSLFNSAPSHPDTLPLVTHYPPTYPGEIDYLWSGIRPECPACQAPMHLDRIRRHLGGWRGFFGCERCGAKGEAAEPKA